MIKEFKGKYFFLSNFYESPIYYEGVIYQNNVAAFQAQKNRDPLIKKEFMFLSPSEAKRKGHQIPLRDDWEEVKDKIMLQVCRCKFTQNSELKKRLLDTGDEILVKGNTWHDNYWGICCCDKCKDKEGKNKLGEILMFIRDSF